MYPLQYLKALTWGLFFQLFLLLPSPHAYHKDLLCLCSHKAGNGSKDSFEMKEATSLRTATAVARFLWFSRVSHTRIAQRIKGCAFNSVFVGEIQRKSKQVQ